MGYNDAMTQRRNDATRGGRPIDAVIRLPRRREVSQTIRRHESPRRPRRILGISGILVIGFTLLIAVGAGLLALPLAANSGEFTPIHTAFFTSISAVTVTGHTVVSTPNYWAPFGQAVIFALMTMGGLGFMVVSTFLLLALGNRATIQQRALTRGMMSDTVGANQMRAIRSFGRNVIVIVLLIYLGGSLIFFTQINGLDGMGQGQSYWYSLFLSVSSFNNAGFNIIPEAAAGNAARFVSNPAVLITMTAMIALGGLGWVMMVDVWRGRRFARFSLDTKLLIVTSLGLWALGGAILALTEFANTDTMGQMGWLDRVVNAVFLTVSGRTAGFSTIDFGQVADATGMTFTALMYIGGAPGSVAGGIKVVTFAVIIAAVVSSLRSRPHAEAFGREISQPQVHRALSVAVLGVIIIFVAAMTLITLEPEARFLYLIFDFVSALGTVGATTGIVPDLGLPAQTIIMLAMFTGRMGPLILALAMAPKEDDIVSYRFAQEKVRIG